MGKGKGIGFLFMKGLFVLVLLILSTILSGIIIIPLDFLLIGLSFPLWLSLAVSVFIAILILGFIFTRVKIGK